MEEDSEDEMKEDIQPPKLEESKIQVWKTSYEYKQIVQIVQSKENESHEEKKKDEVVNEQKKENQS